jgi:hypothetical protein
MRKTAHELPTADERERFLRAELRETERILDVELHRNAPTHGRVWSEHRPGHHGRCSACNRVGRRWVGTYFVFMQHQGRPPFTIHRSEPVCAYHAIAIQRAEWGVPHWRPREVHDAIGHA